MSVVEHRFGPYGGQYVPETLMPALAELELAWVAARGDPAFSAELDGLLRDYVGRPSPLYLARRLSHTAGHPIYLKREDLNHTGAHKINNAMGQALLATRMGKRRIIAETGAGQHGVATATACALLDLECIVYMGTEDMRRQKPNVERMGLLGARVEPVEDGARTLKEAVSAAIRDWVTNVESTHYIIGSCVGPAPYPALVRDLQRVIGDEARAQILRAAGRLPERVIACVGGGSNSIGVFIPFVADEGSSSSGSRRRGRGSTPVATARRSPPRARVGAAESCTEPSPRSCRTRTARSSRPTPSPRGWTTPARAPSTPGCATRAAPATRRSPTTRRWRRFARRRDWRASSPRWRARTRSPGRWPIRTQSSTSSAFRAAATRTWLKRSTRSPGADHAMAVMETPTGIEAIAEAFASARANGRRAALMPYLMGGYPDLATSRAIGLAYAEAGADVVELGVPFSDPLADGPVIHAAGTEALRAGATLPAVLDLARDIAAAVPVVVMCYANPILSLGLERFLDRLVGAHVSGLIVPDLPLEEATEVRPACRRRGLAFVPLVAPTTPAERLERIGAGASGFLYTVSLTGTTGERTQVAGGLASVVARAAAHTSVPVAVGFGISTPEQAAAAADAGADGVIVGSRLVRAAGEAEDPVAAVRGLVSAFAAALSGSALG